MIQFFSKMVNNRKGFTLIELVVVIAILGILAVIAVPRLGSFRSSAEEKADMATARTIMSAATIAEANYGSEFTQSQLNEYLNEEVTLATSAPSSGTGWTLVRPNTTGGTMSVYKGSTEIKLDN